MVILAVETVTRAGSLALLDGAVMHAKTGDGSTTHAERLPREAIDWLIAHGRHLGEVDVLAVVTGPGSFTGLRVGIAAVQGLALAGRRRALGIPTLEAIAGSWQPPAHDPVLAVACLDGQRGDIFFGAWLRHSGEPLTASDAVITPAVGSPDDVVRAVERIGAPHPVVLLGDAAMRARDEWKGLDLLDAGPAAVPLAEMAAVVAATRVYEAGVPHALRPVYIRRPDVELVRERARARAADPPVHYTVRRAEVPRDLEAVERLQNETFTNPWSADSIRWELEHTDVARLYVLEEAGGPVLGFCACWVVFDELHLNSLAVAPDRRRQGLATRLISHVLDEARADGVKAATLEVRSSNAPARQLYEGLGFAVEGVRRDYYQSPREDALILWNRRL